MDQKNLETYIKTAKDAGCPEDQVKNFLAAGYVALPKMLKFHAEARKIDKHNGVTEIMLDGTRGSAKSHAAIAQAGLDDCQRVPGLKGLFLRQTERAASESFSDLIGRVLRGVPHKANTEKVTFPNGSVILIGGYKDESDIDKYIGIEYDFIVPEEATQLKGERIEKLKGSLRTSREDWVPRMYLTTNSGGIGHTYCKERYIIPNRENRETDTRRFFSSYKDNPFINPEYKTYLEGLTGDLAKQWRDCDWDIFAGMAFSSWRYERHVIKPFDIPASWARWRAVDWGFSNPWCCLWLTRNPDNGRIYVYREAYATNQTDRQQARLILDSTTKDEHITITYADPSMWASKNTQGIVTSTADEYSGEGVTLTRADNDRLSGKRKLDRLLEPLQDGLPGIQIFENCLNLIRTLPALAYDQTKTEDVDTDQEDHAYDALRYGLTQARDYRPPTPKQTDNPWLKRKHL